MLQWLPEAALLLVAIVLVEVFRLVFHVYGPGGNGLVRLFDLDGEANIPSWFSSFLWTLAAFRAFTIAQARRANPLASEPAIYWIIIAGVCLYLSLDETATLHETAGGLLEQWTGDPTGIHPVYRWIWFALAMIALVLLMLCRFLLRLPRPTLVGLGIAAAVFLTGAMGLETMGSMVRSGELTDFPLGFTWGREIELEELLEMTAVVILLVVLRQHRARVLAGQWSTDPAAAPAMGYGARPAE